MEYKALSDARTLLIDTCGSSAGVALGEHGQVTGLESLPHPRSSAAIVGAIDRLLKSAGWSVAELGAIGVVRGPGAFTGVRTGLAAAKGLSEAAGLPLVAISRLAVLLHAAGGADGCVEFAALDAGRGELYVRDAADGREFLCDDAALLQLVSGKRIALAEPELAARLVRTSIVSVSLDAGKALALVREQLGAEPTDAALLDALYLRDGSRIYARPAGSRVLG